MYILGSGQKNHIHEHGYIALTYSVEDEVTDNHQINSCLAAQDGEHVAGHTLPKVDKEILHLELEWDKWDVHYTTAQTVLICQ